jgi:hypothetical protein
MNDCFLPKPVSRGGARPPQAWSKVSLLGQDQGVINLDTELSDGAFELRMAEKKLAGP